MKTMLNFRRLRRASAAAVLLLAMAAPLAGAATPQWRLWVTSPDDVTPGRLASVDAVIENVGDVPLTGQLTVINTFPAGFGPVDPEMGGTVPGFSCQIVAQTSTCSVDVAGLVPGAQVRLAYRTVVDPAATGTLVNAIEVSGGGMVAPASAEQELAIGPPGPFEIDQFAMSLLDASRNPAVRAGSTPRELTSTLAFRSFAQPEFRTSVSSERLKDTVVHAPPGLVGNPTATGKCTADQLAAASPDAPSGTISNCPQESQVGIVHVHTAYGPEVVPLYNLVAPPGAPAAFGFSYLGITINLVAKLRASDNGIDIVALNAPSTLPISAVEVTMWGVPADRSHDYLRHLCVESSSGFFAGNSTGRVCPSNAPRKPFLRLPTSCAGALPWSAELTTYTHPAKLVHADTESPGMESCYLVPFDPSFSLVPSDRRPHSPTGVDVNLSLPQDVGPDGIGQADLRTANVTLPADVSISPSSAGGLQACTDAELRLRIDGVATCPEASKIGSVTLTTPLLDHPLGGSIFLRTQASDDPASGRLFRIAVEVRSDDDGVNLKLPGSIKADPITGQLSTTFDELPQLPFSNMQLQFKSGPRAPLTSPRKCGTHTTTVELVSWSDKIVSTSTAFDISGDGRGAPCPRSRFSPAFRAGSQSPVAGKSTPFLVSLRRDDGDELFKALTVESPKGLLGRIKDVELCSDSAANAGSCGAGSLIGRATVGAGAGPNPFFITDGKVYLTGPYKGAPYGLSVVTRAIAGPFDLGTVVVRAAIHLDRRTAQLRVISEPFPSIVKGVPLNLRVVRLSIDKPGFMVNPTNCQRAQVSGTVTSTEDSIAALASRFQVGNCKNLRFSPRISMRVGAPGRTTRNSSTPLVTTIRQAKGQANLAEVKVSLPKVLNSRLPVVERACTLAQFDADNCDKAEVGSAVAVTPLLKDPLRGVAYLVRDPGGGLPDLMIALRGDVDLDVFGEVEIPRSNRIVANFRTIPDAPITRFTLRLSGGSNGPLGVVSNLCGRRARRSKIEIAMRGQNGDRIDKQQGLRVSGCGKPRRGR